MADGIVSTVSEGTKVRGRGQRGAALLELAFILPVFMALSLGTFSGGSAYITKISITDAVREGARYGATLDGAATNEAAWATKVVARVVALAGDDLVANQICVDYVPLNGTSECPDGAAAASSTEANVHVTAGCRSTCASGIVKRQKTLEAFFFSTQLNLTASSFARYERLP